MLENTNTYVAYPEDQSYKTTSWKTKASSTCKYDPTWIKVIMYVLDFDNQRWVVVKEYLIYNVIYIQSPCKYPSLHSGEKKLEGKEK